jgi:hypothetical protein
MGNGQWAMEIYNYNVCIAGSGTHPPRFAAGFGYVYGPWSTEHRKKALYMKIFGPSFQTQKQIFYSTFFFSRFLILI